MTGKSFDTFLMIYLKYSLFHTTGKDTIIFVTKEDHAAPSTAELVEEDPNDPFEERGEKQ